MANGHIASERFPAALQIFHLRGVVRGFNELDVVNDVRIEVQIETLGKIGQFFFV